MIWSNQVNLQKHIYCATFFISYNKRADKKNNVIDRLLNLIKATPRLKNCTENIL